jgi:hypothetical protein
MWNQFNRERIMKNWLKAIIATLALSSSGFAMSQGNAVNATSYGVLCNGTSNDTVAINNALSAASGRTVIFPAGTCLYSGGGVISGGAVIVGAGRNATTIRATSAAATLFTVSGYGSGVRSFNFAAAVTQTGGSWVVLSGPESFIEDFRMTGDYNGILMTGSVSRIRHGRFQDGAPNAIRIRAEGATRAR